MGLALDFLLGEGGQVFPGTPIVLCGNRQARNRSPFTAKSYDWHTPEARILSDAGQRAAASSRHRPGDFIGGAVELSNGSSNWPDEFGNTKVGSPLNTGGTATQPLLAQLAILPAPPSSSIPRCLETAKEKPSYRMRSPSGSRSRDRARLWICGPIHETGHRRWAAVRPRRSRRSGRRPVAPNSGGRAAVGPAVAEGGAGSFCSSGGAARWNIGECLLSSSTILFGQVSGWNRYRPQIDGAILLVGLQTALIGTLLLSACEDDG